MRGELRVSKLAPSNPTNRSFRLRRRPCSGDLFRSPVTTLRSFPSLLSIHREARLTLRLHLSYLSFLTPHNRHYDHQHQCLSPARSSQCTDWRTQGKMIRKCLLSCSGGVSVSANQCKCTLQLGCYHALANTDCSLSALSLLCHGRSLGIAAYKSVPSTASRGCTRTVMTPQLS